MKRVFPTQLRVVDDASQLNSEEESKKGYYDPSSKNSIRIGVRGRSAIYLFSPGNWYRHYVFTILNIPELPKIHAECAAGATESFENMDIDDDESKVPIENNVSKNDDYDLWRIVSQLIKTECGRKVIHRPGQNYLKLAGINKDMAKQFYYLMKHTLAKMGVDFKLTYALFSPFGSATVPDVREKPKRKRQKKVNLIPNNNNNNNNWVTVARLGNQ